MKRSHDKHIHQREFRIGDLVLLFKSRSKLFLGKLRSRWSGPFQVKKIFPYGAIEVRMEATRTFKVNRSRIKHYITGELIDGKVSHDLPDAFSPWNLFMVKLMTLKKCYTGGILNPPHSF